MCPLLDDEHNEFSLSDDINNCTEDKGDENNYYYEDYFFNMSSLKNLTDEQYMEAVSVLNCLVR